MSANIAASKPIIISFFSAGFTCGKGTLRSR